MAFKENQPTACIGQGDLLPAAAWQPLVLGATDLRAGMLLVDQNPDAESHHPGRLKWPIER
jgi:hypothetical protein